MTRRARKKERRTRTDRIAQRENAVEDAALITASRLAAQSLCTSSCIYESVFFKLASRAGVAERGRLGGRREEEDNLAFSIDPPGCACCEAPVEFSASPALSHSGLSLVKSGRKLFARCFVFAATQSAQHCSARPLVACAVCRPTMMPCLGQRCRCWSSDMPLGQSVISKFQQTSPPPLLIPSLTRRLLSVGLRNILRA